jgi:hypothetical protein
MEFVSSEHFKSQHCSRSFAGSGKIETNIVVLGSFWRGSFVNLPTIWDGILWVVHDESDDVPGKNPSLSQTKALKG